MGLSFSVFSLYAAVMHQCAYSLQHSVVPCETGCIITSDHTHLQCLHCDTVTPHHIEMVTDAGT